MAVDLESLHILVMVVESGSFAAAAERLNRPQSAISYHIKKLEEQLGVILFDRSQYRATPTKEGTAIAQEARRLLNQAHYIQRLADRFEQGWEPELELVIDGALPMDPVMMALKHLTSPDIPTRIEVRVEFLGGVQSRFERDEADLMLVKDFVAKPGLVATALPAIRNWLVVSPEHPLAQMRRVRREQLIQFVELTVNDSTDSASMVTDAHQFGGERVFYLSGFIYKKRALEMGLGFGWMPEFLVREELKSGRLRPVDYVGGNTYEFVPYLVWNDARPLGRAGQQLKEAIERTFASAL
ncbi:MAG: LysR family transcriptional regulator [Gammaproteobacteria bacterium]|nr:MAG: LysR family transcriptional regulator [Gammaproteobacteria bacterium]